ncbi:MAG: glycosyltransferase family 1 protein [bacterium]|nr:glycosyltransferase family 1 protein [bacterium]
MARTTASKTKLTEALGPLNELASNLWWTWDSRAPSLFEAVDGPRWAATNHNPIALLRSLPRARQELLARDRAFLAQMRDVHRRLRRYLRVKPWFRQRAGSAARGLVAYFSMEYALHESLPIFAGGLGVLAGDHFKSASDLGLPLVGVGIFWRQGYSRQRLDNAGHQANAYDHLSPDDLPLTEARGPNRRAIRISINVGKDRVVARAWRVDVGRVPIFLLDTDLPPNAPRHRRLTHRLYCGDRDTRIRQEILLGVGGWRLLRALNLPVRVCHLNEGHAAFCSIERAAERVAATGCRFDEAARRVAAATVFTTHTPVPEGNEVFDPKLAERYLGRETRRLGITWNKLVALGRVDPADGGEGFGMTPLALRLAKRANGVSQLHGRVSRGMWQKLWPGRPVQRVPIGAITNGIHLRTWLHPKMADLLEKYLPSDWEERQDQAALWQRVRKIPSRELWNLHLELKAELIDYVRNHLTGQGAKGAGRRTAGSGSVRAKLIDANHVTGACWRDGANLDPEALTIGFARRFATYKRATLIFSDLERLDRLIKHARRPVQVIFAGKAHPSDAIGQGLVAEVAKHARSRRFGGRIVFLADYNMAMARHLVAGVDIWLNNPRRPQEASGTSGMKPALHGGLNLSILDGWWPEACRDGRNGWSIGTDRDHTGTDAADRRDARSLYQRLERDVIRLYYDRGPGGRPARWITCMKHALADIPTAFNSHRMVKEYLRRYYLPALKSGG